MVDQLVFTLCQSRGRLGPLGCTQEHLECFMLMALEKDIISNLDDENNINIVATKSIT